MATNIHVRVRNLSYSYDSSPASIFQGLTANFGLGFTGIIGPNGSGKTTLLRLLVGELQPDEGDIEGVNQAIYCQQRTDMLPPGFDEFLLDWEDDTPGLRNLFGIEWDFLERWQTLSDGERKRAQIATSVWRQPKVLAIDEPTNHIDRETRGLLLNNLKSFDGVGMIVSHDRDLLDELCYQCLWLEPPASHMYSGGYSNVREQRAALRESSIKERAKAKQTVKKLQTVASNRRGIAASEPQHRSKRGLALKDNDGREKINRAIVADAKSGKSLRQLDGRLVQAEQQLNQLKVPKEFETGIWLKGSVSKRSQMLELNSGELRLGESRQLFWSDSVIGVTDRIAFTGPNGHGKSTLIRHLLPQFNAMDEQVVYIPQEITEKRSAAILAQVKKLPDKELGVLMAIVSRLASRPGRLLDSQLPSPGETRKLLLALGMVKSPHVIVMDEPTNHLDIVSIEALEAALKDCPCALLIVSHDEGFLNNLQMQFWRFRPKGKDVKIQVE